MNQSEIALADTDLPYSIRMIVIINYLCRRGKKHTRASRERKTKQDQKNPIKTRLVKPSQDGRRENKNDTTRREQYYQLSAPPTT